jgi:diguanylate cyclase (GGDEF)-like protein/PAS domain S-box-containing protein
MTDTVNMLQLFRLLPKMLDEIEDSIFVMRVDSSTFRYYYINRAATELSGITMDAAGQTFFETNKSQMADFLHKNYTRVLSERTTIKYEDGFVLPNGVVSGESILTPIFEENGQIEFILCITRNTTERKKYEDLLRHYAYHDDLTRLFNRRYLLESTLSPSAIFLLDLDYFKNINDTFGHDAGDAVLVEVASRLSDKFGAGHTLVRLGGDEFIIVSTEGTAPPERVAERINEIFLAPYSVNEQQMKMSVSIGVARRDNKEDIHTLLKQADIALYRAKGEGRKRFHVYEALSKYDHVENFIHELALSNAIALGELELHYQPIYQPSLKKIIGAEALLRWNRSDLGILSPSDFIPVAEQTGLIRPIGYWVIRKACQDWHKFKDMYGFEFRISVNISRVQLTEDGFVDQMLRILASENVSSQVIELEITETMVIDNVEEIQRILMRLRKEGFTISLDDFGTGYSSLSMLTLLPIDKLKIDKSFIQNMNPSLVSAILVMAKALNLLVIAEGVEGVSQYTLLKEMNCWGLQGFFISKPVELSMFPTNRKMTL